MLAGHWTQPSYIEKEKKKNTSLRSYLLRDLDCPDEDEEAH
jgi:hypothetical protein